MAAAVVIITRASAAVVAVVVAANTQPPQFLSQLTRLTPMRLVHRVVLGQQQERAALVATAILVVQAVPPLRFAQRGARAALVDQVSESAALAASVILLAASGR